MQINPDSGEVVTMACGTWSIKGDQFTANPKYGMGTAFLAVKGTKNTFTCKIVGDRWYHTGYNQKLEEVWQRQRPKGAESKDDSTN
jgi:hypothetical protein